MSPFILFFDEKKEKGQEHCRNTEVTKLTHYDTKEDELMNVLYV